LNRETRFEAFLVDGALGPAERVSVLVVACNEAVDMLHEFLDTAEGIPCSDWLARMEDQISIWFSHDAWVGV